jgi:hypothetical protein
MFYQSYFGDDGVVLAASRGVWNLFSLDHVSHQPQLHLAMSLPLV